jgi:hypothetical protein
MVASLKAGVLKLFIPVFAAALAREVEEIPDRFEGADVTRILSRLARRVESKAVQEGHGASVSGSFAVAPDAAPGLRSPGSRGNIML